MNIGKDVQKVIFLVIGIIAIIAVVVSLYPTLQTYLLLLNASGMLFAGVLLILVPIGIAVAILIYFLKKSFGGN